MKPAEKAERNWTITKKQETS